MNSIRCAGLLALALSVVLSSGCVEAKNKASAPRALESAESTHEFVGEGTFGTLECRWSEDSAVAANGFVPISVDFTNSLETTATVRGTDLEVIVLPPPGSTVETSTGPWSANVVGPGERQSIPDLFFVPSGPGRYEVRVTLAGTDSAIRTESTMVVVR